MIKHPVEGFFTWFISTTLNSPRVNGMRADAIAQRRQRELRRLHDIFDDYHRKEGYRKEGYGNTASVIRALGAISSLDEVYRAGFVGEVRGILKPYTSRIACKNALDTLVSLGDAGIEGVREVAGIVCRTSGDDKKTYEKALGAMAVMGVRAIETRQEMLYEILDQTVAHLGKECLAPSMSPHGEQIIRLFAELGLASLRNRVEPVASTVVSLLDPLEKATKNWCDPRESAKVAIAVIRSALPGNYVTTDGTMAKKLTQQYQ